MITLPSLWGLMSRCLLVPALFATLIHCGDSGGPGLPDGVGIAGDGNLPVVLESIRDAANIPSLGAALFVGDQLFESAAVGVRANGSPETVTATDRWHIGSITKAMTATLAAMLVEDGVIAWETTVGDVFPDFVSVVRNEFVDVRLDELLYHTSGMTTNIATPSWPNLRTDPSPVTEQRRQWAKELLSIEPEVARGTYLYSNAGYVVAGTMLEEVTGESWETLMQRELFDALGMSATGFGAPGSAGVRDDPWGHVWQGGEWVPVDPGDPGADNPVAIGPAGTVHTTFPDFASYVAMHLAGAHGEDGILTAATFAKLHTAAPGTFYALGWGVAERTWAGGRVLQHTGSNTLWLASLWLAPERNFGMLAVTNVAGDDAERANDLAVEALIDRFIAAFGGKL